MRRLGPAAQSSPADQVEDDGDNLIPFAKCSRVVSRPAPTRLPARSLTLLPQRYGAVFWESLSQRPSPTWTEEQNVPSLLIKPVLSRSGLPKTPGSLFQSKLSETRSCPLAPAPPHSPAQRAGCSQPQPGLYSLEGLPPPEVLCRRKRRRPPLAGMQQGPAGTPAQVRAVTYHLEDLRRRQRVINELKKAQWGDVGAAPEPLAPAAADCGVPSTAEDPGLEEARAAHPQEGGRHATAARAQLLWSPWSPLGQGGAGVPRRLGSLASYSTVPAASNRLHAPWGAEVQSEE
ncbi:protein INCA1 isoform X2 [Crocuta crocuta]